MAPEFRGKWGKSVVMRTENLNTRLSGSLCLPLYVGIQRVAKKIDFPGTSSPRGLIGIIKSCL